MAVLLVIGAGLLVRSFAGLMRVDPGMQPDNLVATRISLPAGSYRRAEEAQAFWEGLRAKIEAAPGIAAAAIVRALPLRDEAFVERFLREGETHEGAAAGGHVPSFEWQMSFPGYFRTLGIPLLSGRDFDEGDRAGSGRVAVVNETLARRYFRGESPVGERIRILAAYPNDIEFEIVGVAADVRHAGRAAAPPAQIFTPYLQAVDTNQGPLWSAAVVVRTQLATDQTAALLREAAWDLDAGLPLAGISTMNEVLRASLARPRFTTLLLGVFSALALVLACVGIYGVVSYGVAQGTREMGIRVALGARRGSILGLVLRQAMAPVAAGIVLGAGGALLLTRFLEALLYGVTASDPATFAAVVGLVGGAALLAAWVPARRAVRVDPLVSLRAE